MTFKNIKLRQLKKNNLPFNKISLFLFNIYEQIFFSRSFFSSANQQISILLSTVEDFLK